MGDIYKMKTVVATAVKAWEEAHEKEISSLDNKLNNMYLEVRSIGSRLYGKQDITCFNRLFDEKYEQGELLGQFMKKNCSELVELLVPEELVEDYYCIVDEFINFPYTRGYNRRTLRTNQARVFLYEAVSLLEGYFEFGLYKTSVKKYMCDELDEVWLEIKRTYYVEGVAVVKKSLDDIIAARINSGDAEVIDAVRNAFLSENNYVIVTVELIRAVVKSRNLELRSLLGKFLVAARLQEGLRQAICENADCGLKESLFEIMEVISENNLLRFSAVKRAVATWTGICNEEHMDRITDKVFECAFAAVRDKESAKQMLGTNDSLQIVMGLWGIGFYDVIEAVDCMWDMFEAGNRHGLLAASYFNLMLMDMQFTNKLAISVIEKYSDDEEMIAAYLPTYLTDYERRINDIYYEKYKNGIENDKSSRIEFRKIDLSELCLKEEMAKRHYEILKKIRNSMKKNAIEISPCIFPWYQVMISKSELVKRMAAIAYALDDEVYIDEVCQWLTDIRGNYSQRSKYIELLLSSPKNAFERGILIDCIKDKESGSRKAAYDILINLTFSEAEYIRMEGFLKYKNDETRRYILELIRKQESQGIFESAKRLLGAKDENMILAGLDLAKFLCDSENENKEMLSEIKEYVEEVFADKTLSAPIKILYNQIMNMGEDDVSEENGLIYGLYDDRKETEVKDIEPDLELFHGYFNMTREQMEEKYRKIVGFVAGHFKDEYKTSSGERLLGNGLYVINFDYSLPIHERYPFVELWEKLYDDIIQTPQVFYNLKLALNSCFADGEDGIDEYEMYKEAAVKLYGNEHFPYSVGLYDIWNACLNESGNEASNIPVLCSMIMTILLIIESVKGFSIPREVLISAVSYAAKLDQAHCWYTYSKRSNRRYKTSVYVGDTISFADDEKFRWIFDEIRNDCNDEEFKKIFCSLYHMDKKYKFNERIVSDDNYIYMNGDSVTKLNVYDYIKAFSLGIITENDVYKFIFDKAVLSVSIEQMGVALKPKKNIRDLKRLENYLPVDFEEGSVDRDTDFYKKLSMINSKVIDVVLSVELNRGDSETQFSKAIRSIKQIYGVKRLVEILCALGDMPLDRNTYYSYMKVVGKKECLCHLLRVCEPYKEDNVNIFAELVKKNKISQDRLVQVAMYAPQWMPMIEEYLECDGFASGCYYFMAHMNEYFDEKTEAMIAKYTPLTREELNDGAFDLKWFFEAYNRLGEKMFDKLYKSAKYISDGSKHTRARKYAMAALGKVDKKELEREITDKRNKDLLMSYALIPIEGKDDVQGRYEFVQKFLKESKQFGAQRRASESKAVEMTIKNLSCLAGYEDELRLTLAMEADMAAKNNKFFDGITIDEYHIMIVVDVLGKASVQIEKDGKKLKSIPAQLKKVQEFLEIKEFEKKLKEQYKRCVAMFERAMEDSICYQVKELKGLFINPVTRSILERLVFIVSDKDNKKNGSLCLLADFDVEAEKEKITGNSGDTMVRIAHPVDFYRSGEWGRWQKYFFELNKEQDIKQPFKQVFREYYPKLEEELGTEFTRQFAGYQISVQRTIAALKTRGWVADYENGLQKVYYKDNIVAVIYALADWFSPADTEAPTIEYVKFFDRKTFEPKILEDVPDIIFSEVCRDTDLAVSLANVGGVEPETTHSTIEMRTVIAKFNLELFGISNVTFDKSHAFIKGKYAEYSIHLGSGVIHIVGGRMVSVLPVHTQKRGKIFLPFIDDDPKTAEIMTKILIFAKDNKIKDPYIMEQILGS